MTVVWCCLHCHWLELPHLRTAIHNWQHLALLSLLPIWIICISSETAMLLNRGILSVSVKRNVLEYVCSYFNSFNCKELQPPLNCWRVTVICMSLCYGLVHYTCCCWNFFWFGFTYHLLLLLFCTQHSILERGSVLLLSSVVS